jgi:hypothetical protein
VLYTLARALRERPEAVKSVLDEAGAITREAIEAAMRPAAVPPAPPPPAATSAAAAESPDAAEAATATSMPSAKPQRLGNALLVEHAGRRARLGWAKQPGRKTGEVMYEDDGTTKVVRLSELKILEWTVR